MAVVIENLVMFQIFVIVSSGYGAALRLRRYLLLCKSFGQA
jgi:hypothetical protein